MLYIFISLLVFLTIGIIITIQMKKKKKQIELGLKKQEHLSFLNEQLKLLNKSSDEQKMHKEEIKKIKAEIEQLLNKALDNHIPEDVLEEKAKNVAETLENIKHKTKKQFSKKEELSNAINDEVGRFKVFLNTNVFYPKEFLFTANTLQGKIIDLNEAKPEKLPKLIVDVEKQLLNFKKELKEFFRLHNKLRLFIKNTPELTGNDKQQIYFLIQNGKLEEAEAIMDSLSNPSQVEQEYVKEDELKN